MALASSRTARAVKILAVVTTMALLGLGIMHALAVAPANPAFERAWERADRPVADGEALRTWLWGPEANTGAIPEQYLESPGGVRIVQYYDKSRMEITSPDASQDLPWYVTNGLLVNELISGRAQIGHALFQVRQPAAGINVAGDPDDPDGPTYATFGAVLDAEPLADGAAITQRIARDGAVSNDPSLAAEGVTAAYRVQAGDIDHQIASPFWEFMTSEGTVYEDGEFVEGLLFENAFYATGYPISEAYWASVKLEGAVQDILIQCFERRCLTYTPGNVPGWEVEAGNVGQHYYLWRYPDGAIPNPTPTPTPTPAPTPVTDGRLLVADLSGEIRIADGGGFVPIDTDGAGVAYFHHRADGAGIDYQIVVENLLDVTAAHLHAGEAGEAGPAILPLFVADEGTSITPDGVLVEGTIATELLPDGMTMEELADLMAGGEVYVNVQTTAYPTGEISGQTEPLADTTFEATLTGDNQMPPVITNASGEALFVYSASSATIGFALEMSDISGLTAAHIHAGAANVKGPVLAPLFVSELPVAHFDDEVTGTISAANLQNVTIEEVVYLMLTGNAYVNAHTVFNPDGEIRGQIARRP